VPLTDDPLAVLADVLVDAMEATLGFCQRRRDFVDVLVALAADDFLPRLAAEFRLRVAEDLLPGPVQGDDFELAVVLQHSEGRLFDEQGESFLAGFELPLRAVLVDRVPNPVGEDGVLTGAPVLLEVVGHARRDSLARNLLVSLPGKEDKREVGVILADGVQKRQPVPAGHVVVADDAVHVVRVEIVDPRGGARRRPDSERVVLSFQKRRREVDELRVVVNV